MSEQLAIYIRPGGHFIVKPWEGEDRSLWALLDQSYTRESAKALAAALERDHKRQREEL